MGPQHARGAKRNRIDRRSRVALPLSFRGTKGAPDGAALNGKAYTYGPWAAKEGTYTYFCPPHAGFMKGTINVGPRAGATAKPVAPGGSTATTMLATTPRAATPSVGLQTTATASLKAATTAGAGQGDGATAGEAKAAGPTAEPVITSVDQTKGTGKDAKENDDKEKDGKEKDAKERDAKEKDAKDAKGIDGKDGKDDEASAAQGGAEAGTDAASGAASDSGSNHHVMAAVLIPLLTLLVGVPLAFVFLRAAGRNAEPGYASQNDSQAHYTNPSYESKVAAPSNAPFNRQGSVC